MSSDNVIGPFDYEDWAVLRILYSTIQRMRNEGGYTNALRKDKKIYSNILKKYLTSQKNCV